MLISSNALDEVEIVMDDQDEDSPLGFPNIQKSFSISSALPTTSSYKDKLKGKEEHTYETNQMNKDYATIVDEGAYAPKFDFGPWKIVPQKGKQPKVGDYRIPAHPIGRLMSHLESIWLSLSSKQPAVVPDYSVQVRWHFPNLGWVKLNVDGASKCNGNLSSCGGVLWDERGHWISCFSVNLGTRGNVEAGLFSLLHGLTLA
ncbi:Ribonuclease H protein [Quillaja saponaria]|uniref:Ribonuclease H protein n=1 Tax=Quillaja saponaria TaxID=32244 RepID=A0AAD7L272_QUISA|nr:Ribonuclease H protein [Quillaja saponaria]